MPPAQRGVEGVLETQGACTVPGKDCRCAGSVGRRPGQQGWRQRVRRGGPGLGGGAGGPRRPMLPGPSPAALLCLYLPRAADLACLSGRLAPLPPPGSSATDHSKPFRCLTAFAGNCEQPSNDGWGSTFGTPTGAEQGAVCQGLLEHQQLWYHLGTFCSNFQVHRWISLISSDIHL